jgi:hypothetical protein
MLKLEFTLKMHMEHLREISAITVTIFILNGVVRIVYNVLFHPTRWKKGGKTSINELKIK